MCVVNRKRNLLFAVSLAVPLLMLSCSNKTPEERLRHAASNVKDARSAVSNAREALASDTADAKRQKAEVDEAREKLYKAQARLAHAADTLEQRATDVALFRVIQRSLLDADELRQSAVMAHVKDGSVTLEGTVPDQNARDHAIQIAKTTPGVQSVTSNIEVRQAPANPNADASVKAGSREGADGRGTPGTKASPDASPGPARPSN